MRRRSWQLTTFVGAALFLHLAATSEIGTPRPLANPWEPEHTTTEVNTRCRVSSWCVLGGSNVSTNNGLVRLFLRICSPPATRRNKPVQESALWQLFLAIALAGDVHTHPGPQICQKCCLCDKVGAKTMIRIKCSNDECRLVFHATCLNKRKTKQEPIFRRGSKYTCWGCTFQLSESFLEEQAPPLLHFPPPPPPPIVIAANSDSIKIICFNARSLKNNKRQADISAFIDTHAADICAINETWLSSDIKDHEFIPRDYVVFRKDRIGGKKAAGGVALAIQPHLHPRRLQHLEGQAEIVWAAIKAGDLNLLIGSAYRRPNATTAYNAELARALDLAAAQQHTFDGLLVMGDFNLAIDWRADPPAAGAAPAADFADTFASMALTQFIQDPTRTTDSTSKTIDLFLCDAPALVSSAEVVPGVSDHDALRVLLSVGATRPISAPKTIFDWRRADWKKLKEALEPQLEHILHINDLEEANEEWKKTIFECVEQFVPVRKIGGRGKKKNLLPWMTKELKIMLSVRDNLFKEWLRQNTPAARQSFLAARKCAQSAVRLAKDRWMWQLGRGAEGSKFFWRYINAKAKVPINATSFIAEGKTVSMPQEIASSFSDTFKKNFSSATVYPYVRRDAARATQQLSELQLSQQQVENLLKAIKPNASAGPDGLNAPLLRNCAPVISKSLAHIFRLSLEKGELCSDWKKAAITPLFKDGDRQDMNNYRPISVTSLVGKTLERFVRDKTAEYLERNCVIPASQHGFRLRRSCTTLLTGLIDNWTAALDAKSGTHLHAIFLDFKRAFDQVNHARLLSKLKHYGINGQLLKWYTSFLLGRTQFVQYNGARSAPCEVISGVIQGSVLGPLLFNLYVADLPSAVKNPLIQYADDATLYKEIRTEADVDALQDDLCSVEMWCANNGMQLNPKKCKVMDISHGRSPQVFQYVVSGEQLEYTANERLLGVNISSDLRWQVHTDKVRAKAAQILGFASRNLHGCTPRVKRMAYLSLVKPIMLYGSPAWHPSTQENTKKLERVQKRALRFIHGRHLPPLRHQQIMPIPMQLQYNDLNFFKKCESGATDFDARARITEGRVLRGDGGQHPRLQQPPTRTVFGQRAFSFRVVKPWNDLPDALKDCSADQFPPLCKVHLWNNFVM